MSDTLATLAGKLRPYWLRDQNGGLILSATAGGSMTAHALNGPYHTGTIDEAQAPWAISSTTFSAHTTNPDAHHNRSHGITSASDHTVAGSQWQIVGLTATNTLGLLTASATPGVNQVVKTDGSSKVTLATAEVTGALYVDDIVDFGTDYITEGATYLSVFGTKPVYFNQAAQSSGWSISTGGAASFAGGVTVTANDLLVNGTGTYAGVNVLFADSSGGNVGIDCVPDPQFALDVLGPARATYFVGPHALQLKDALLIAHYDGKTPFEENFTGDSNGHMGQVGTATGGVIFCEGKFGKAVEVAVAATNLVTNPSFETGTTGWSYTDSNASGTAAQTTLYSRYGDYCVRLSNSESGGNDFYSINVTGLAASTAYTISAWVYAVTFTSGALSNRGLHAYDLDNTSTQQNTTITGAMAGWERHVITVTTTATGGSHTIQIRLYAPNGYTCWDAVQLEAGANATPYCDGSLGGYSAAGVQDGSGHTWSGTAHASTSSRAAGIMSYPTNGNINPNKWSIGAWVNPAAIISGANQTVLRITGSTAGWIILRLTSGQLQAYGGTVGISGGSVLAANTWTHIGAIYDGATVRLYVNGVYVNKGSTSGFSGMPAAMYIGCNSTSDKFNGLIDDLFILGRAMTVAADDSCVEMRAVYESNAPVFAESSRYAFRATPKNLVWGDDEGLWVRDTAGNAVFGIYGNETGGKSWGNITMDVGDIVIGTNSASKSAIRWDASAGTFGFYGNGNATAQAQIGTDGVLFAGTAGAQRVQMSSSEIAGYNSSNQRQWYGDATNGKFYGGEGAVGGAAAVWMDRSGLSITAPIVADLSTANTISFPTLGNLGVLSGFIGCGWNGSSGNPNGEVTVNARTGAGTSKIFLQAAEVSTTAKFTAGTSLFAAGDSGSGVASQVGFTNASQGVSTGTGTVKLNGTTARNSTGWIKIWVGTTARYLPYWDTVTG